VIRGGAELDAPPTKKRPWPDIAVTTRVALPACRCACTRAAKTLRCAAIEAISAAISAPHAARRGGEHHGRDLNWLGGAGRRRWSPGERIEVPVTERDQHFAEVALSLC